MRKKIIILVIMVLFTAGCHTSKEAEEGQEVIPAFTKRRLYKNKKT